MDAAAAPPRRRNGLTLTCLCLQTAFTVWATGIATLIAISPRDSPDEDTGANALMAGFTRIAVVGWLCLFALVALIVALRRGSATARRLVVAFQAAVAAALIVIAPSWWPDGTVDRVVCTAIALSIVLAVAGVLPRRS